MQVICRSCGKTLAASDLNMEKLVARCTSCDTIFDFSDQVPTPGAVASPRSRRASVPMPQAIMLRDNTLPLALPPANVSSTPYRAGEPTPPSADFEIVRRWFSKRYIFMAFFCVAWDSFLIFWYSLAMKGGPWIMSVFPIAHVAVGVGLTYSTLAGFLNRTTIAARGSTLTIRHAPIPWSGNRTLATADIDQLFCQQKISGRNNSDSSQTITYDVSARMKDGSVVKLLGGLPEADQALFIEQAIETRLGIEDVPVGGELAR